MEFCWPQVHQLQSLLTELWVYVISIPNLVHCVVQGVLTERLEDLESQSGLADGQEVSGVPECDVGQAPALHLLPTWQLSCQTESCWSRRTTHLPPTTQLDFGPPDYDWY